MCRHLPSQTSAFYLVLIFPLIAFFAQATPANSTGIETDPQRKIFDTTFTWRPWCLWHKSVKPNIPFYVGGRFVGFGADGFKAAIEKFKRLPRGASVVWGPDCGKMPSGPGNEVVARDFFPELWKDFLQVADDRGIILSSKAWPAAVVEDEPPELPAAEYVEPGISARKEEIIFQWEPEKGKKREVFEYWHAWAWPIYSLNGSESGSGRGGFLATLNALREYPNGSLLRVVHCDISQQYHEPPGIGMFNVEFRELVAAKIFRLAVESPRNYWPKHANRPAQCRFTWRNFSSMTTPHDEVVYLVDGKVMGMGDGGFTNALNELRKLPPGAQLEYPRYCLHPQAYSKEQREAFEVKNPLPFSRRGAEFMDVVKERGLVVDRVGVLCWPKPEYDGRIDEGRECDWFLDSLLRFAIIIRDDAKPSDADAVISWKQDRDERRRPLGEATFFYNGEKIGAGTSGFLAVLKRLESLNDGATVRIDPVCIRTHGPFADAVIMKGQRHFETTGEESFRGLVDLLAELAEKKRFHVEVIPDEARSYHCPGGK